MSDTSLNKIIQYGTSTDRIAFTPDPAASSQVLYLWYETDNAPDTYAWDGSAWVQINAGGGGGGAVTQIVTTSTATQAALTTNIPIDDTIPQSTEGDQVLSLAITPTDATHKLLIEAVLFIGCGAGSVWIQTALFQDSGTDALAAGVNFFTTSGAAYPTILRYSMTAGTTSATTFKVRVGQNSGTAYINGNSGGRFMGGVMVSNLTITEYT
jgi:hypothetical protein